MKIKHSIIKTAKLLAINIFIIFFLPKMSFGQAPNIQWQKSFGGTLIDRAYSIQPTTDGGFIIAGGSTSNDGDVSANHGGYDLWIVKINSGGNLQWQKSFGGSGLESIQSIKQTSDGGFILAATSISNDGDVSGNHGNFDFWIVKLDLNGNLQWQKSLGGTGNDQATCIETTSDGGYIVAGFSTSNNGDVSGNHGSQDFWIVKLSSSGNVQWQKSLGGSGQEGARCIKQTLDGFIVAGYSYSNNGDVTGNHGSDDGWVVKLNNTGILQWQKTLGGSNSDDCLSIEQTSDGGFVLGGSSKSNNGDVSGNHGGEDFWVVKLNNIGNLLWQKSLGGSGDDIALRMRQTSDSGFILAGYSNSSDGDVTGNNGGGDYWVVKVNSTGILQWQKTLGGSGIDEAWCIQQTSDGGFILAGSSNSSDGDVTGNHGGNDFWVVKLNSPTTQVEESNLLNFVTVYPNPVSDNLTVLLDNFVENTKMSIHSIEGKLVYSNNNINTTKLTINTDDWSKGVYTIKIYNNEINKSNRFIRE